MQSIPTVMSMKGGKLIDKFVGLKDDDGLQSFVSALTLD